MSSHEFTKLVKSLYDRAVAIEIAHIYRHVDKGNKGYVTRQDWVHVISSDIRETSYQSWGNILSIEDIVKPLATRIRKQNVAVSGLFDKYDKNRNNRLSAEELAGALLNEYQIKLQEEEIMMIKDHFKAKTRSTEISKTAFIELLQAQKKDPSDASEAMQTLFDIKMHLQNQRTSAKELLTKKATPAHFDAADTITTRKFKIAIAELKCVSPYSLNNLTKHMDSDGDGFISIAAFVSDISTAFDRNSTHGKTKSSGAMGATMQSKWTK
jgi:Ca2+-binding EF-hand superfamily protein